MSEILPSQSWYLPRQPLLSLRRLTSLVWFEIKRAMGLDRSFAPLINSTIPIDLFMPTIEKDSEALMLAIEAARQYIKHPIGSIYIVAPAKSQKLRLIAKQYDCVYVEEDSIIDLEKNDID